MRFKLITALTALAFAAHAFAIEPASEDAKEAIRRQIVAANQMDENVIAAKRALDKTSFPKDSPDYIRLARTARRVRDKQYAAYTKAIHMAIIAYDLEPRSRRGVSVMPWTKGREVVWLPVAGEDPTRELEDTRGNRRETSRTPLDWAARTFTDGVTYINPETLRKGPDFLASTLLHERTHFEQNTTRGRGDTMSTAEAEVEAYQTELDNLDYFFDQSNPNRDWARNHIETLRAGKQSKVDEQRAAKKGLRGLVNRILPSPPNPDFNDATLHTDAELEALKKQSDKFSAEAQANARQLAQRARAQAEIAHRDHDNRLRGKMIDIAVRACTAPERVNQAELDALPEPNDANFVNIGPGIADDCVIWVYRDLRRGVDLTKIRNRAAAFAEPVAVRPIPPSPVDTGRRVTNFQFMLPGVKDFAVASCRSPGQVPIPYDVARPYGEIFFIPTDDDRETVRLSSGLGVCEARLFHRLVELIRGGSGPRIDNQWVIGAVRAYTPAPSYSEPTPPDYSPPPSQGDPCRDNHNIRCP